MDWFLKLIGHKCEDECKRPHVDECRVVGGNDKPIALEPEGDWPKPKNKRFQIFHLDDKTLEEFKEKLNEGVKVVNLELTHITKEIADYCKQNDIYLVAYMSASYEDWRGDAKNYPEVAKGKKMSNWDELWGNLSKVELREFLEVRMKKAAELGASGCEVDNLDLYLDRNHGFPTLTKDEVIHALIDLSTRARRNGLGYFLKNCPEISEDMVPYCEGVFSEGALKYSELDRHEAMLNAGKPVYAIEYTKKYAKKYPRVCVQYKDDYFSDDYTEYYEEN